MNYKKVANCSLLLYIDVVSMTILNMFFVRPFSPLDSVTTFHYKKFVKRSAVSIENPEPLFWFIQ